MSREVLSKAPSQLSPILVGVLIHKKILPHTIAAFIIDLCNRGYLFISKNGGAFSLARRRPADEHLQPWEAEIMAELVKDVIEPNNKKVSRPIFEDPQVFRSFGKVYQVAQSLNFFKYNPRFTRIHMKLVGLALYTIGAIGLICVAIWNLSAYSLLAFGLLILLAMVTFHISQDFIRLTPTGASSKSKWLEFKTYLESDTPLNNEQLFIKYLPYAMAMDIAPKWAARFSAVTVSKLRPEWYDSKEKISIVALTEDLTNFTTEIGHQFILFKGPQVN